MRRVTKSRRRLTVGVALIFAFAVVGSSLAATAFDPGFGDAGVVETPLPAEERQIISESGQGPLIWDLAQGRRDELVAAVASGTGNGFFGAASYRADGTLDSGFDDDGFLSVEKIFPGLGYDAQAQGVAVQRDGKVLLVGYRIQGAFDRTAPVVMRLRSNGRPDLGFGGGGLIAPQPKFHQELLHAVAVQPGGRIIAVGSRDERRGRRPAGLVVGYRKDGRLDRRFGDEGRVLFATRRHGVDFTGLFGVSILPSGKVLVAGYRNNRIFVARLRINGGLDRTFGGGDGKVSIDVGFEDCCPETASLFAFRDGSSFILANQNYPGLALVRLRPDGRLDPRFGRRGIVIRGAGRSLASPYDVAVQGNGRIVVVGFEIARSRRTFVVLRYRPDGRLDRGFGKAGVKSLAIGRNSVGTSAVRLPNGRVVVGGGTQLRRGDQLEYSLLLARLRP